MLGGTLVLSAQRPLKNSAASAGHPENQCPPA